MTTNDPRLRCTHADRCPDCIAERARYAALTWEEIAAAIPAWVVEAFANHEAKIVRADIAAGMLPALTLREHPATPAPLDGLTIAEPPSMTTNDPRRPSAEQPGYRRRSEYEAWRARQERRELAVQALRVLAGGIILAVLAWAALSAAILIGGPR